MTDFQLNLWSVKLTAFYHFRIYTRTSGFSIGADIDWQVIVWHPKMLASIGIFPRNKEKTFLFFNGWFDVYNPINKHSQISFVCFCIRVAIILSESFKQQFSAIILCPKHWSVYPKDGGYSNNFVHDCSMVCKNRFNNEENRRIHLLMRNGDFIVILLANAIDVNDCFFLFLHLLADTHCFSAMRTFGIL